MCSNGYTRPAGMCQKNDDGSLELCFWLTFDAETASQLERKRIFIAEGHQKLVRQLYGYTDVHTVVNNIIATQKLLPAFVCGPWSSLSSAGTGLKGCSRNDGNKSP